LINLLATEINSCEVGGQLAVRTFLRAPAAGAGNRATVVVEIVPVSGNGKSKPVSGEDFTESAGEDFGMIVARKIVQLYGGKFERRSARAGGGLALSFPV
jgi:hypothetical protein